MSGEESRTLAEIKHQLAFAQQCQRMIRTHANNICQELDIAPGTADAKDVERCAFGRITLDEMLRRIKNRKLDELSAVLIADSEE